MTESEERTHGKGLPWWFDHFIKKHGWVGVVFSVLLAGLGVWINAIAYVLAAITVLVQIVYGLWKYLVAPRFDELQKASDSFAKALNAIISRDALYTVVTQLSPKRTKEVLEGFGVPVLSRALELQGEHPLTTRLNMVFRGDRVEHEHFGELLVLRRTIDWSALLLKENTKLTDLIKPIFVCTSYVHQIPFMRELAENGHIDLLWPIPWGWMEKLETGVYNQLKNFNWLTASNLTIEPGEQEPLRGTMEKLGRLRPENFDAIWQVLSKCVPKDKLPGLSSIDSDTKNELVKHCMLVLYIKEDVVITGTSDTMVCVKQESTYKVWVRGKIPNYVLYRYEVPFLQPARVKNIKFGLEDQASKHWILDPASVNCAFPLENGQRQSNPREQELSWTGGLGEGVPFLPGHGVSFLWRNRIEKP